MLPTKFVPLNFGALVDMLKACREPSEEVYGDGYDDPELGRQMWLEAAHAMQRAIAIVFAGGYAVGVYKGVFFHLDALLKDASKTNADIALELLNTYGRRGDEFAVIDRSA